MSKKIKQKVKPDNKVGEAINKADARPNTVNMINEIITMFNKNGVPASMCMHVLDMTRQEIADNVTIAKVLEVIDERDKSLAEVKEAIKKQEEKPAGEVKDA